MKVAFAFVCTLLSMTAFAQVRASAPVLQSVETTGEQARVSFQLWMKTGIPLGQTSGYSVIYISSGKFKLNGDTVESTFTSDAKLAAELRTNLIAAGISEPTEISSGKCEYFSYASGSKDDPMFRCKFNL